MLTDSRLEGQFCDDDDDGLHWCGHRHSVYRTNLENGLIQNRSFTCLDGNSPHSAATFSSLSPLGEACSRKDLTTIHEVLEKLGYKDDEGVTNETRWLLLCLLFSSCVLQLSFQMWSDQKVMQKVSSFKDRKALKGSSKATKKQRVPNNVLDDRDLSHILWWKERMDVCKKPKTVQLLKRLEYSNLLGLDCNLRNGRRILIVSFCLGAAYHKSQGWNIQLRNVAIQVWGDSRILWFNCS
ncbi:DNA mismatch repair ATPase msh1 [Stylosanthes scabra]|uniref:DNA mismatch repair ATPase msh1 n=1 Tax=Stylosanthes scabra TaxID=79078 RepID=A0ABU6YMU7_9FABA|nr:DNA mismatch repair ATPase msh1 [Stylosanthes scabra]